MYGKVGGPSIRSGHGHQVIWNHTFQYSTSTTEKFNVIYIYISPISVPLATMYLYTGYCVSFSSITSYGGRE